MILIEKIKDKLVAEIAGISIHQIEKGELEISFVHLVRKKGKITQLNSKSKLHNLAQLKEHIKTGTPVWLALSGKGILSRKLDSGASENVLHTLLPNAKMNDFFVTAEFNSHGNCFASALRRTQLNTFNQQINELGYPVFGCSLGCMAIDSLVQNKLLKEAEINIPNYTISTDSSSIISIEDSVKKNENFYTIGTDQVSGEELLAFSLAFNFLAGIVPSNSDSKYTETEVSYVFKKLNQKFLFAALGFIFLVLLINFMLFNSTNQRVNELSNTLAVHQNYFNERDSLQKEILSKSKLVNESGLSEKSLFGFYADRVAASIPRGITLVELSINPAEAKIKRGKSISFSKKIRIRGTSPGSLQLNDWIDEMEKLEWLNDIEVINYKRMDNIGEFEIELYY